MSDIKTSIEASYAPTEPDLRDSAGLQDNTSCETDSCNEEVQ